MIDKTTHIENTSHKLRFICCPGYEMIQSLYVLNDPEHHEDCLQWAEQTWNSLSAPLKREIKKFLNGSKGWSILSDFWTIEPGINLSWNCTDEEVRENINAIKNIDEPTFSIIYLGLTTENVSPDRVMEWFGHPEIIRQDEWAFLSKILSKRHIEYYLTHMDEVKNRFAWIVIKYWEEYFRNAWPKIAVYINAESEEVLKKWNSDSLPEYIKKLHKDIIVDEDYFLFLKEPDYGIMLEDIYEARMMLSVFSAPHLMVNTIGSLLTGSHNIKFRYSVIKDELPTMAQACVNALNDKTRCRIIKFIWEDFHTTQELATLVGISESGVSLHLKILKNAELVDVKRIKKRVFYRMKKNVFENAWNEIETYMKN